MKPYGEILGAMRGCGRRLKGGPWLSFDVRFGKVRLTIIASNSEGWDHVSVSLANRCPTWEEMCFVKDLFFWPGEWVLQYHPAKGDYVNCHPFVLHLWRPQDQAIPRPPVELV